MVIATPILTREVALGVQGGILEVDKADFFALATALDRAHDHLDWTGYGDSYERDCAKEEKLEEVIIDALKRVEKYAK